jgi:hypothetical protein
VDPPLENPRDQLWTVGARIPHRWLDADRTISTVDLAASGFALLVPPGHTGFSDAVDEITRRSRLPITLHEVDPSAGIEVPGAVLVRPDGVIAWVCTDPVGGAAQLAGRLVGLLARTSEEGLASS